MKIIEYLIISFTENKKEYEGIVNKNIVILLGMTGVSKSTTYTWILKMLFKFGFLLLLVNYLFILFL